MQCLPLSPSLTFYSIQKKSGWPAQTRCLSLSQMKLGERNSSPSVVELYKDLSFSLKLIFGLCASKEQLQNSNSKWENNKELKMCYLLTYLSRLCTIVLENTLACIRMAVLFPSLQLSLFGLHYFLPLAVIPFIFSQKHPAYPHFLIPDTKPLL